MEVIKAQEMVRRAKKEAELAISRANDSMIKVQQELYSNHDDSINLLARTDRSKSDAALKLESQALIQEY